MRVLRSTQNIRSVAKTRPQGRRRPWTSQIRASSTSIQIPDAYTSIAPKGDNIYVKCSPEEVKSLGGILLPSAKKPTSGVVVQVGDGRVGSGKDHKFTLKKGDSVIYSKFGFAYTELEHRKEDYLLIREDEVIGIMPNENPTADDVPKLKPLNDRILIKVDKASDVTSGGVMLPETAKEKPLGGKVVATGAGKNKDGEIEPPKVKVGDMVLYFQYAGEKMETTSGDQYIVLREADVLCKA